MKTTIYYFSATGNSFDIARKVAKEIDNSEIISISKEFNNHSDKQPGERIGFIFPVYAWGLPGIVTEFVGNLKLENVKYCFGIASSGGVPGNSIKELKKILKFNNIKLNAGFVTKDKSYADAVFSKNFIIKFVRFMAGKSIDRLQSGQQRIKEIAEIVRNNQNYKIETSPWLASFIGGLFHNVAINAFKGLDKNFYTSEKCNSCGICQKVCPRANIDLNDKKIIWNNNCEQCLACLQWCPQKAIHVKNESTGERSHNPLVKIRDMIIR